MENEEVQLFRAIRFNEAAKCELDASDDSLRGLRSPGPLKFSNLEIIQVPGISTTHWCKPVGTRIAANLPPLSVAQLLGKPFEGTFLTPP